MLSVDKGFVSSGFDLQVISKRILSDNFLLKLLYYPSATPWDEPELVGAEKQKAYNTCVRLVPKMIHDENKRSFIVVTFDKFRPSENPAYRNNMIYVDVVCPLECWSLSDKMLRPYKIMDRIERLLTDQKLNGIGRLEFVGADSLMLGEELAGFTMAYKTINDR